MHNIFKSFVVDNGTGKELDRDRQRRMTTQREPGISLGLVARATRLITRLGRYQVVANDGARRNNRRRREGLPRMDSSDSDEDYTGEEENEEEEEEDQEEVAEDSQNANRTRGSNNRKEEEPVAAPLDHEITQSTAMRHCASVGSARLGKVHRGSMVNVATMLAGREFNVSGNGRFSRAECCHVGERYLPTDGPTIVERLNSRAYIGQFSNDGTLFIAGFQVSSLFQQLDTTNFEVLARFLE